MPDRKALPDRDRTVGRRLLGGAGRRSARNAIVSRRNVSYRGSSRRVARGGGHGVQASEARLAAAAAQSTVSALGLPVDDAVPLSNSNRLVVRLMPCDVV